MNKLSVRGRQQRQTFKLQLPLDHWHLRYLQVAFLPPQGSILVCKYDGYTNNTLYRQYISGTMTNKKLPCMLQLEPSSLWLPKLHSGSSPALLRLPTKYVQFSGNIWMLKLKICGIWSQTSRQTYTRVLQCSPASVRFTKLVSTPKSAGSSITIFIAH